jgi:nicotinate-nucleotide--dimethylbenzimidazole phosphoribosyltransferase
MLKDRLPLQAVGFTAEALLAPPPSPDLPHQPRPGVRRLIHALRRQGLSISLLTGNERASGQAAARLTQAGLGDLPVMSSQAADELAVGEPTDFERPIGHPIGHPIDVPTTPSTLAPPNQTLVVTGPTDPVRAGRAGSFAGTVMAVPDQPLAKPVLTWLAGRIGTVDAAAAMIAPLDAVAAEAASERQLSLTKPPGSLGRVEALGIQLAGIAGQMPPPRPRPATLTVFAGDHGVHAQGVSPWPQEVTGQMVLNFLEGGAAINVLANGAGAEVMVVDVGVIGDLPRDLGLLDRKVAHGTRDLTQGPAMSPDEAWRALETGVEVAVGLVAQGVRCLLTGDMGIANTTPAAALTAALTDRPAADVTGRGSGLPEASVPRKTTIVAEAAARARDTHGDDPLGILAEVGGLEHAALAGYILGGAALGVPVVIDGLIAASGLLVASRLVPGVETAVIAGHRSAEPGSTAILEALRLEPVLDLDLRLGEGTGAALALPIVEAAGAVLADMATFDQAGISAKGTED